MVKSICFTGHRHIAKEKLPAALAELRRVLETAIPQGFVDFYAGGALGWDTYCAQTVLDSPGRVSLHRPASGAALFPCGADGTLDRGTESRL